jgi:hypothetical protein
MKSHQFTAIIIALLIGVIIFAILTGIAMSARCTATTQAVPMDKEVVGYLGGVQRPIFKIKLEGHDYYYATGMHGFSVWHNENCTNPVHSK